MNAWLVQTGRNGEREGHNLEIGVVGGGVVEVGDLAGASGQTEVLELVKADWATTGEESAASTGRSMSLPVTKPNRSTLNGHRTGTRRLGPFSSQFRSSIGSQRSCWSAALIAMS